MAKLFIILYALIISTANADEWRLNLNNPAGHHSFRYSGSTLNSKRPHDKTPDHKRPHVKPYPPYRRDPGFWYGYPRLSPGYGRRNPRKETIIIKEKEVIREAPVIIQAPEPERIWVPPVYEEKIVPGHYSSGFKEWIDEKGYRNFTDDDSKRIWIPEHTIKTIKQEGYWR